MLTILAKTIDQRIAKRHAQCPIEKLDRHQDLSAKKIYKFRSIFRNEIQFAWSLFPRDMQFSVWFGTDTDHEH